MSASCDLCNASSLEQVYAARKSGGIRTVWLCSQCGLLQSLPRAGRGLRKAEILPASRAKSFRAEASLATLKPFLSKQKPLRVLDVGAGHGAFAIELQGAYPNATVVGIEPDAAAASAWAGRPGFTWLNARIEDTRLESEGFDLIHSCHTLERLMSARQALLAHRAALSAAGHLFLEVPNTASLSGDDVIDEFFADEHLYHFSVRTLTRLLASCGLRVVASASPRDTANITVVAVKAETMSQDVAADPREVEAAAASISAYHAMRMSNLAKLTRVACAIGDMAPRRVVAWGAGRLLRNLITNGGLRPQALTAVVDRHQSRFGLLAHGIPLTSPEDLARVRPDIVVVMSRNLTNDTLAEAKASAPGCEVVAYADLLARAA